MTLKRFIPYLIQSVHYDKQPNFVLYAGLQFQPLDRNMMAAHNITDLRTPLLLRILRRARDLPRPSQVVVLTEVLPDATNTHIQTFKHLVVDSVNGKKITLLQDVFDAFHGDFHEEGHEDYHIIRLVGEERPLVLKRRRPGSRTTGSRRSTTWASTISSSGPRFSSSRGFSRPKGRTRKKRRPEKGAKDAPGAKPESKKEEKKAAEEKPAKRPPDRSPNEPFTTLRDELPFHPPPPCDRRRRDGLDPVPGLLAQKSTPGKSRPRNRSSGSTRPSRITASSVPGKRVRRPRAADWGGPRGEPRPHHRGDVRELDLPRAGTPLERARVTARIKGIDYEANLAVLEPADSDSKVFEGLEPLSLDDSVVAGDKLNVWQVEDNGDGVSTDVDVLRVDVGRYFIPGSIFLLYQVKGSLQARTNSFTLPVVKNGKLVGMLLSYSSKEQTASVLPAPVISAFLADLADGEYEGFRISASPSPRPSTRPSASMPASATARVASLSGKSGRGVPRTRRG